MKRSLGLILGILGSATLLPGSAHAFCGFYVAKADASLYNQASQVVMVRDGERTVLTMSNDYQGELKEFALVVPVPTVLHKEQIHVGDRALVQHLDAYTAPRLVEYFDDDPCQVLEMVADGVMAMNAAPAAAGMSPRRSKSLGVTIEAQYTIGEYDILILSAAESDGLETWLIESGYKLPKGASTALAPYIRQGLKFFVAKVNLAEQEKTGFTYLRPLQMAYESPRFMLPIRLGMLNAKGAQDLLVYTLTRSGRVETTNYRTTKIPSEMDLPPYVKDTFAPFYRDMFATAWTKAGKNAVFLEYFWDMSWCDPCAADPLSPDELRNLGVFWLNDEASPGGRPGRSAPIRAPQGVLVTRLHVRYDAAHFPEDLAFQETQDRQNFQGRYVLRQPFTGPLTCAEGTSYAASVRQRREQEAKTLASLTGWSLADIHAKMGPSPVQEPEPPTPPEPWWKQIWK